MLSEINVAIYIRFFLFLSKISQHILASGTGTIPTWRSMDEARAEGGAEAEAVDMAGRNK